MPESFLSFNSSAQFRNSLITRNLPPYSVPGSYTPPVSDINYPTNLTVTNVIDSPNNLISTNIQANSLYSLNEYGPEGGYSQPISLAGAPLPVESNKGPYDPTDTALDLVNEFFIDSAFIQNKYGPEGGFNELVTITDITLSNKIYLPYWEPPTFSPSTYSPYEILFSNNPTGNNGSLSQDSFIAQFGAKQLKSYFEDRVAAEIVQTTVGRVNLNSLSDPFSASLIATGKQPLIEKNWKITVPENPIAAAVSLGDRLSGSFFPASFIPGDYFDSSEPKNSKNEEALNVVNNLTGGALGPILNKYRNPSEIFVANTGNGQRSILFSTLDYNKYRPDYNRGIIQSLTTGISRLLNPDKPNVGGYYVGSPTVEPSKIESPPNQLPVDATGKQIDTLVYGPSELGILYEGNETQLNFGLKGKSYTNSGSIDGQFVWTSPKYKDNAGFKVTSGGATTRLDDEFNFVEASYNSNLSVNVPFKVDSILDSTQRLVNSADNVQGEARLKHVGNAINQVSKVFNDGYKEITKGSQVFSYKDQTDGSEVGIEYCRIFTKDTPYFTYNDLQKTDGITQSGRKFTYSVFDNTYNLNIAPLRGIGSTNIINNKVKKYMFSIENLAWRTSDRPGFTYDELPVCEKGPNGGRIMWFPPYDLTFSDSSKPDFNSTSFLGRPEPIYTYKNTSRGGSLSWKIIVDNPSSLNTIIEKQLENVPKERLDSIVDSFFAGCTKYDLYQLAIKYNQIPVKDLFVYQELLNNPRLTAEEFGDIIGEIPTQNTVPTGQGDTTNTGGNQTATSEPTPTPNPLEKFEGLGFYFYNDIPKGSPSTTAASDFGVYFEEYKNNFFEKTKQNATTVYLGSTNNKFDKSQVGDILNKIVVDNFNGLSKQFLEAMEEIVIKQDGIVKLSLAGSSSAVGATDYNVKLSQRRISAVQQWLEKQVFSNGKLYKDYINTKIIYEKIDARGETETIPKSSGDVTFNPINCTVDPKEVGNNKITTNSLVNSIPAIACRRVLLTATKVEVPPPITPPPPPPPPTIEPTPTITAGGGGKKPIPQVDIKQKVKEGISKKILRQLFSECDYFDVIKKDNPMVYDTFKDKIKYFNPAFHSMTPEGLNARLTFLNQCARPGQTIPVIGPDGRPKYNDALNTAFGAPPVLVLRIGDFYHSKIIPTDISFTYEPLLLDINPEGIGIQPMIAKVSMSFNFIGGHGLKEPVEQLQNALSFNYYGNTEVYDERSVATEDTSERDNFVVESILNGQKPVTTQEVVNQIPQKGGDTIGNILTTVSLQDGSVQTGETEYTQLVERLSTQTNEYFKTMYNQLKTISNTTNYGIQQLVLQKVKYNGGSILNNNTNKEDVNIVGKPEFVEQRISGLIEDVVDEIKNNINPIINKMISNPNKTEKAIRDLKDELIHIVRRTGDELNNITIGPINELTKYQENYVQLLEETDAVIYKIDGTKMDGGIIKVYDLIEIEGTDVFNKFENEYKNVGFKLNEFIGLLISMSIFGDYDVKNKTFGPINQLDNDITSRFYMIMCQTFIDDVKYNEFKERLLNLRYIKTNTLFSQELSNVLDDTKKTFKSQFEIETKLFSDFEVSPKYKEFETFTINPFDTKVNYTSNIENDKNEKEKIIRNIYRDINTTTNNKFNGKVKFN